MKGNRKLLIGIILGAAIGWSLTFFLLPFSSYWFSFFLGIVFCLVIIFLVVTLLLVWKKQGILIRLPAKGIAESDTNPTDNKNTILPLLLAFFVLLFGIVGGYLMYQQNDLLESYKVYQERESLQEAHKQAAITNSGLGTLMNTVFDQVNDELKQNPDRVLSDELIRRIASLSYSYKQVRSLEGDSLSDQLLSRERGQLLLALSRMEIDTVTFRKLLFKTDFSGADLKGAEMYEAYLRGGILKGASFRDADLRKANLSESDLMTANLWGANLTKAKLYGADMTRVDLQWADFTKADLRATVLNGANLSNARLWKVDMSKTECKNGKLNNAYLKGANLSGGDFSAADFRKANLSNANLSGCKLKWIEFREANLRNANLSNVDLTDTDMSYADLTGVDFTGANLHLVTVAEKDWFEKLKEWNVKGVENVQEKFTIDVDPRGESNYRISPKKK